MQSPPAVHPAPGPRPLRARGTNFAVHVIKTAACRRRVCFARFDPGVGLLFGLLEPVHFRSRLLGFRFQAFELLPGMVGIEHLQIRMQRLIAPRLSCLPLERAYLALHFLNDVADPEKIPFRPL